MRRYTILMFLILVVLFVLVVWLGPRFAKKASASEEPVAEMVESAAEPSAVIAEEVQNEVEPEPALPPEPDDLKIIEGIGPKISSVLNDAGINTFAQLAGMEAEAINEILDKEPRLRLADPTSWPTQAGLAASGSWTELEVLQDNLKGGRKE